MTERGERLRVGVIGVGLLGERHARFWAQQEEIDLVGVADARLERAEGVAARWGTAAFASADDLMSRVKPDIVSVATPDFLHREPVITALEGGAHVLVEKPLALTTDDARAIVAAAERCSRHVMVNHSMRWIPWFASLKQSIISGALGDVVAAHSFKADTIFVPTEMLAWANRSTPAYFLTAHDLDLVRWFVDDDVDEVYAQSVSRVLHARGVTTPDVVQASVRFRSGTLATFEASWILPNSFPALTDSYMHILGSQGSVFVDRGRETLEMFSEHNLKYPKFSTVYEHHGRIYGSFRHALEHFVECVRTGEEPLTSAERVFGVVAALEAIHRSLDTRQPVTVASDRLVGA